MPSDPPGPPEYLPVAWSDFGTDGIWRTSLSHVAGLGWPVVPDPGVTVAIVLATDPWTGEAYVSLVDRDVDALNLTLIHMEVSE